MGWDERLEVWMNVCKWVEGMGNMGYDFELSYKYEIYYDTINYSPINDNITSDLA